MTDHLLQRIADTDKTILETIQESKGMIERLEELSNNPNLTDEVIRKVLDQS